LPRQVTDQILTVNGIVVFTLTAGNLHTNQNPNLYSNRVTVSCSIKWFMQPYL